MVTSGLSSPAEPYSQMSQSADGFSKCLTADSQMPQCDSVTADGLSRNSMRRSMSEHVVYRWTGDMLLLLGVMCLLPIFYVVTLPTWACWCRHVILDGGKLETVNNFGDLKDDAGAFCFAYRCYGFPSCDDNPFGMTVSEFIKTPPSTGFMVMSFTWPLLALWEVDSVIVRDGRVTKLYDYPLTRKLGRLMMPLYQLSLGAFVICSTGYFPLGHNIWMALAFMSGTLKHIWIIWVSWGLNLGCSKERKPEEDEKAQEEEEARSPSKYASSFLVMIAISALIPVVYINQFYAGTFKDDFGPFLFYRLECMGLSAMALFPLVFLIESRAVYALRDWKWPCRSSTLLGFFVIFLVASTASVLCETQQPLVAIWNSTLVHQPLHRILDYTSYTK